MLYFLWTLDKNFFAELQVNIRSIDEAVVIGAALSLSSSAFVLQVSNHMFMIKYPRGQSSDW